MPLPADYEATRASLHLVATHVLAQARYGVTGRFGLRATPDGFGTPAFGAPAAGAVLRVAGTTLVRETQDADAARTRIHPLDGASLAALAEHAGIGLDASFRVGKDTPLVDDADAPLHVDADAAGIVAAWFDLGAVALDGMMRRLGGGASPSVVQLWPEHFDLATDVGVGAVRCNVGVSAGDRHEASPYAYVGPRTADRPGDPEFWNAAFGAFLPYAAITSTPDPLGTVGAFFAEGLARFEG